MQFPLRSQTLRFSAPILTAILLGAATAASHAAGPSGAALEQRRVLPAPTASAAVAVHTVPAGAAADIDYVNAEPMALPQAQGRSAALAQDNMVRALLSAPSPDADATTAGAAGSPGAPVYVPGASGDGRADPVFLGRPRSPALSSATSMTAPDAHGMAGPGGESTLAHGTLQHPFSAARADNFWGNINRQYPFRATGKLFFTQGGSTFVCSGAMIRRGIVVTAAHCLAEFGGGFHSGFSFVPGYRDGSGPFGAWSAAQVAVLQSYLNGTDRCSTRGVVCENDVGVIRLVPKSGRFAGHSTGFYGYAVNGFGFSGGLTHVTQLGYPVCLDNGVLMQRNDSHGYADGPNSGNTVIGSLMCGGSSGGPWLLNFGRRPALTGTNAGIANRSNVIIGVTSWGYTDNRLKEQGASPFTQGNIGVLANQLCGGSPNPC